MLVSHDPLKTKRRQRAEFDLMLAEAAAEDAARKNPKPAKKPRLSKAQKAALIQTVDEMPMQEVLLKGADCQSMQDWHEAVSGV